MREHFHTERYIFPVGYEVTRCVYIFSLHVPEACEPCATSCFADVFTCFSLLTCLGWLTQAVSLDDRSERRGRVPLHYS